MAKMSDSKNVNGKKADSKNGIAKIPNGKNADGKNVGITTVAPQGGVRSKFFFFQNLARPKGSPHAKNF